MQIFFDISEHLTTSMGSSLSRPFSSPRPLQILLSLIVLLLPTTSFADTDTASTNGTILTIVAYAIIWLFVLFYLFTLAKRQKRLDNEINELRDKIDSVLELSEDP